MIFIKATLYKVASEKIKGFIDYLYVFVKKAQMQELNLSFEYAITKKDQEVVSVLLVQRWTNKQAYEAFVTKEEFKKEFFTLKSFAKETSLVFEVTTAK
ncbi:antibiotic biosynthesis monooxygenase family protein [Mycoplasmopsis synoviae]|uniref:ABM domain-containing protein n=2 Tax=Mycoplasmopsis synoviae TaxID=2109 RepID=A0AAQ2TCY6_MYCSY|nr:hypothetical protein [Mycoplasmopsis synoviae]AKB11044.1 hypothetical protein VY93_01660 [Mycoplasmopsis synoviae ATCC 25204]AKJ20536.1 hypothetical protein MSHv_00500 [Mycoplasmopsis synoviae]AQU47849.1 hypothetical protein ADF19_00500 [Mycoplasmopsis synoviae]AWL84106.1 hypothetical protein MSH_01580 [Mycoplasmopsis synoviae]QGL45051.1 hypothetical protein EJ916_00750 [Mycoplasmopsis synoviae]